MVSRRPKPNKQDPPVQFRPGARLEGIVRKFAAKHGLAVNEACKALVALAAMDLDQRFYSLVAKMGNAIDGVNGFTEACVAIHAQLEGARRATNQRLQMDPKRAKFIEDVVVGHLEKAGQPADDVRLDFLAEVDNPAPATEYQIGRGRRIVHTDRPEPDERDVNRGETDDEEEHEQESRAPERHGRRI